MLPYPLLLGMVIINCHLLIRINTVKTNTYYVFKIFCAINLLVQTFEQQTSKEALVNVRKSMYGNKH
jgi:hypothetical protein